MPKFSYVEVYPPTGHPHALWGWPSGERVSDAFLRSSRPVAELYSERLTDLGVEGLRSMLRIAVGGVPAPGDEVEVRLVPGRPAEFGEMGFVHLPGTVGRLSASGRAHIALEAVHAAVQTLAGIRGWDPGVFAACRDHVLAHDLTFRWSTPWKASPGRRHEARAAFVLTCDDGFGRVRLQVRARGIDADAWTSEPAVAFCTSAGFSRSWKTLRWLDKESVSMVPYGGFGPSGLLQATIDGGGCRFLVRDDVWVRPPDDPGSGQVENAASVPVVVHPETGG